MVNFTYICWKWQFFNKNISVVPVLLYVSLVCSCGPLQWDTTISGEGTVHGKNRPQGYWALVGTQLTDVVDHSTAQEAQRCSLLCQTARRRSSFRRLTPILEWETAHNCCRCAACLTHTHPWWSESRRLSVHSVGWRYVCSGSAPSQPRAGSNPQTSEDPVDSKYICKRYWLLL